MAKLRVGTSYWLDRYDGRVPVWPSLRGTHDADVVIVGGGVTGCACGYLFARAGFRVVILEARRIGRGSTAASTSLLMQEPDADFCDLADRYGAREARTIWHQSRKAVRTFISTLQSLNVTTLHELPSVYFTQDPAEAAKLRRELARRHEAGLAGRWLAAAALKRATGIDGAGGILTLGNAQVDPYRACLALAGGAQRLGVSLFERSRARIEAGAHGVEVTSRRGRVRAAWAIVATGYATPAFQPLAGRFRMMNTYVIGTRRLPKQVRERMGLSDLMLWDSGRPYHYARWTPDHRLLFGGQDRPALPRGVRPAVLQQRMRSLWTELGALYPPLRDVQPDYAWEGLFAMTPDGLPYIGTHRRYPRHLFALGYGGNGMTFGFLAGEMLLRAVRGRSTPDDALLAFGRTRKRS